MLNLQLFLLGRPEIRVNNQVVTQLLSKKAQALIFYLAITKQTHSRQHLAGLLWPEYSESRARNNLRVELSRLNEGIRACIEVKRHSLTAGEIWVDVAEFERLSGRGSQLPDLETAVAHYKGDFLDDFHLLDTADFEHWVILTRESLRRRMLTLLQRLAIDHTERGHYAQGVIFLRRMLEIESYMEWAHRQLMTLLALDGQRAAALIQYELCQDILQSELGVEPSDATRQIYEQIQTGQIKPDGAELVEFAQIAADVVNRPLGVPSFVDHFVGREELLALLATELTSEDGLKMALIGMGGVGKTALSTQLAWRIEDNFPDGVLWGNVATTKASTLLEKWGEAFGYDLSHLDRLEDQVTALQQILVGKRLLVVLDDMRSGVQVRPLLVAVHGCTVLATTRQEGLAQQFDMRVVPLTELTAAEGLALLTNMVGIEQVESEAEAAEEICAILQNLPLAIEIAASRIKTQRLRSLMVMVQRLRDKAERLNHLRAEDGRAVRISFEVSWDSLAYDLRQMVRLLAVFEGRSFKAAALGSIAELTVEDAEDKLFNLHGLSLVQAEGEGFSPRYHQHPLLADFALEKLQENNMVQEAFSRMAWYYQQFAAEHQQSYEVLRPEWGNMMAGISAALQHGLWQLVVDYGEALNHPWFWRGRYTEAREGYEKSYHASLNLEDENFIAYSLLHWARACVAQNDYDEGLKLLRQSEDIYTTTGNEAGLTEVRYHIGRVATDRLETEEARQILEGCIGAWERLGDQTMAAAARYTLSRVYFRLSEYDQALLLAEQAQEAQARLNQLEGLQRTLRTKAQTLLELKREEEARHTAEEALVIAKQMGQPDEVAYGLNTLTGICRRQEDYASAERYAIEGAAIVERTGAKKMQALFLYELSIIKESMEAFEESLETALDSLTMLRRIDDQFSVVIVSVHLGDVYVHLGQQEEADRVWRSAYDAAKALGNKSVLTALERRMGGGG